MCSDASLLDALENIADVMAKTTSPSIGPRVLFCSQITSYAYCLWHFMASVICGCLYSSFLRWNVKIKRDIYFMHIAHYYILCHLSCLMNTIMCLCLFEINIININNKLQLLSSYFMLFYPKKYGLLFVICFQCSINTFVYDDTRTYRILTSSLNLFFSETAVLKTSL